MRVLFFLSYFHDLLFSYFVSLLSATDINWGQYSHICILKMEYAFETENYLVFFFLLQNSYANRRGKNTGNECLPLGCANLCNSLLGMRPHTNLHNLHKPTGKLEAVWRHACMFLSIQLCYVGFNSINRKCKFIHTLNHTDEGLHLHTLHNSIFFFFFFCPELWTLHVCFNQNVDIYTEANFSFSIPCFV